MDRLKKFMAGNSDPSKSGTISDEDLAHIHKLACKIMREDHGVVDRSSPTGREVEALIERIGPAVGDAMIDAMQECALGEQRSSSPK